MNDTKWLWPGYVPFEALTTIAGVPGIGKTRLACSIAAKFSSGAEWPEARANDTPPGRTLFVTEDCAPYLRSVLESFGADLSKIDYSNDFPCLGSSADLLIIDASIVFRLFRNAADVRQLGSMARSQQMAVIVLKHLDGQSRRAKGTDAVTSLSRLVWLLSNPHDDADSGRLLSLRKSNYAGHGTPLIFDPDGSFSAAKGVAHE